MKKAVAFFILVVNLANGCPTFCVCKWKNGKQTVECINKELLVIPEGMDSGTQVLEFCGNNLHALHTEKFLKMDLINLQRIYLCRCRIISIDGRAFKGLTNLVELDLSGNLLEAIPSSTFLDCPSLMRLTLSSNPIKTLRRAAFSHLSFLTTLELGKCEISSVEPGAFQGLYSLEWLYLNDNKMTTLKGTDYLPETLKGFHLEGNPWECDCHIRELNAWLQAFSISHTVEPVCKGPYKLQGRTIKSVPEDKLACLPDVSPTTFYLEIGEGKNVSLLCHVHAIPQATISWTFQGQLLQNDSIIAPGVHLLYYIENGSIEKRSELFIYNTNTDDNGTFICSAENQAGVAHANFTIRVVVKQEPIFNSTEISFEFVIIIMSAAALSVTLLLLVLILSLIKCHKSSLLKKKRNNSKVALSNSTKDNLLHDSIDEYSDNAKESGCIKLVNHEDETMLYSAHPNEKLLTSMSPIATTNQTSSPISSLRRYQLEQNPDLINGTESVNCHFECDVQQTNPLHTSIISIKSKSKRNQTLIDFKNDCDLYMLTSDVHLNPVGLLNPADSRSHQFNGNCYKTLPYNRNKYPTTITNPLSRYSRDAEFLPKSNQPASYEHYTDIRYTADGYPPPSTSPAESNKSDISKPCCSTSKVNWPSCLPANLVKVKCVDEQTQIDNEIHQKSGSVKIKSLTNLIKVQETLIESPDEGYEETIDNTTTH